MLRIFTISIICFFTCCIHSQDHKANQHRLIGNCEGCEAIFEFKDQSLKSVDTLPDFNNEGTRIKISGTVYKPDGKTPASGVILYIYHTNQEGLYASDKEDTGWAKKHGNIRGWMITDKNGKYTFYTLKPGAYPSRSEPAHIHIIVLEPDGKYYWLDSYHFAGDPLLTDKEINPKNPRGGSSGIISLVLENRILCGERNIVLGKNIPGYNN